MAQLDPISAASGIDRINSGAVLIDVRSEAGRAANGTIPGARIVAKDAVNDFAAELDAETEVVVFCGSIEGSGPFVDVLDGKGFTKISHIDGGFAALKHLGVATVDPEAATDKQ